MATNKYHILKEYKTNLMNIIDLLGTKATSNIELNNLGKYLFNKRFIGVYPSNKIPILKNNEMCIINTDDKNGVHWCCLYKYNNNIYFYDSFARSYKTLSPFWKNKKWISTNINGRDQSINTSDEMCGQISMAYLTVFDKYKTRIINII